MLNVFVNVKLQIFKKFMYSMHFLTFCNIGPTDLALGQKWSITDLRRSKDTPSNKYH